MSSKTIVADYINATVKNTSLTDIISAASTEHLDEVNRLYIKDSPDASKVITQIDDVILSDGNLVLIKNQHDPTQNGIYTFTQQQPLTKLEGELQNDTAYVVENGKINALTTWVSSTGDGDTVTFEKLENYTPAANANIMVQQTVSGENSIPLTISNSDFAITKNFYIAGAGHQDALFSISSNPSDNNTVYDIQANNASINIGVNDSNAISIGTDNAIAFSGPIQTLADVSILGNLSIHGAISLQQSFEANKLHLLDSDIIPGYTLDDFGQLILCAADSSIRGPHITTFSTADANPILNICSWAHDDISINMDCFFNGTTCYPSANSSCQIKKNKDTLQFTYLDSLLGAYRPALSFDLTDGSALFSSNETIFSDTNGTTGSIKVAPHEGSSETSIAFYTTKNLRNSLPTDFWKLSLNNATRIFGLYMSKDIPALTINELQQIVIHKDLTIKEKFSTLQDATFAGSCSIDKLITTNQLHVISDQNASADGSAAVVINGGVQIGKSLMVNDQIATARLLLSSASPRLVFNGTSLGTPTLNETSLGTRLLLQRNLSPATTNAAIGVSAGNIWQSVPGTMEQYSHQWYAGSTSLMKLDGVGNFVINGAGNTVSFFGLSDSGVRLSGPDNDAPCVVNFAKVWTLGQNSKQQFALTRKDATDTTDTIKHILTVERDSDVVNMASAHFSGEIVANSLSCNEKISFGSGPDSKVRIGKKGITFSGSPVLTFPYGGSPVSLQSTNNTGLSLNSDTVMSTTPRTSITDINRNNKGETRIWNGDVTIVSVDESGLNINGNVNIQQGNIKLQGDVITTGTISGKSLEVSQSVQIGDSSRGANILTFLNDSFTSSIGTSAFDNQMSIQTEENMLLHADKIRFLATSGIDVLAPKFEVSALSITGPLSHRSDILGNLTTKEGPLRAISLTTTISNNTDAPNWYYVGRLNTTDSGTGPDECGSIHVTLRTSPSLENAKYEFGETTFAAFVKGGAVHASHELDYAKDYNVSDISIFKNDDSRSDTYGDFNIYILCKNQSITHVSISSFISARSLSSLTTEGSNSIPDGRISGFTSSWSKVYSTNSPASVNKRLGSIVCNGNLESYGSALFHSDVHFSGAVTVNSMTVEDGVFSIFDTGHRNLLASFSNDATILTSNIIPSGSISLGDPTRGIFDSAHVKTVYCDNIVTKDITTPGSLEAQTAVFSDFVQMNAMQVRENATIVGRLLVKGETSFDNRVNCESIVANEGLSVNGDTTLHFARVENELVCRHDINILGNIKKIVPDGVDISNVTPLTIESDTVQVASNNKSTSISSSGKISSTGGDGIISLCPGGEASVFTVSQNGKVTLGVKDKAGFVVNSKNSTFFSNTVFKGESTFSSKTHFNNDILIASNRAIRVIPNDPEADTTSWKEDTVMTWTDGMLNLCVPGGYGGINSDEHLSTPKLSIDAGGHVSLRELTCDGQGTFSQMFTDNLTSKRIFCNGENPTSFSASLTIGKKSTEMSNVILVDEQSSSFAGMYVDGNGFTMCMMGKEGAEIGKIVMDVDGSIVIDGQSAHFTGDVQSKNGISVGSDSVSSKGILVHTDVNGNNGTVKFINDTENSARVQLYSATESTPGLAKAMSIVNDGGKVVIHAAGKRGMTINEISGNAAFDGAVFVQSALDVDTVAYGSEGPVASLNTVGGAVINGNMFVKRRLILSSNAVNNCLVSLEASASPAASTYNLVLPPSLPEQGGSVLSCDLNGNLSWIGGTGGGIFSSTASSSSPAQPNSVVNALQTYSARNGTDDKDLIVSGVIFSGHRDSLEMTVVMVTDEEKKYAAYTIKGLFKSDSGWEVLVDNFGDDVPVHFSVQPFTGKMVYKTEPVDKWISTTFYWSSKTDVQSPSRIGRFGQDGTIDSIQSLLTVDGAVVYVSEAIPESTEWSASEFKKSTLNVIDNTKQNSYSVSTVSIEDAPESNATDECYALHVKKGRVVFSGTDDDLVHSKGGLIVDKTVLSRDLVVTDTVQIGVKGTPVKCNIVGKCSIGESGDQRISTNLKFPDDMGTTNYCIYGNVISAQQDDAMYVCNFKKLRTDGCTVDVFRLDSSSWKDTSVTVHYHVVLSER